MRRIGIILFVIIMIFGATACGQADVTSGQTADDAQTVEDSTDTDVDAPEPTAEPTTAPTAEPAPTSAAVSQEFYNDIMNSPIETMMAGIDKKLYEPLMAYIDHVSLKEEKEDGRSKYKVQLGIGDISLEELKQLIESSLGITFDSGSDYSCAEYEEIAVSIFSNDYGIGVDYYIPAKDNQDIKGINYYSGQINGTDMPEDAELTSSDVSYNVDNAQFTFGREYMLPQDKAQTIIEEYETELSLFSGYKSELYDWGEEKGTQYTATLSPGIDLYVASSEDLNIRVYVNIHPITLFDSEFVLDILDDPVAALLSQRAIDIYDLVECGALYIAVTEGESDFFNHVYCGDITNGDQLETLILDKLNPEDPSGSLADKGNLYIEEDDSFVQIGGEWLPGELRFNVETSDTASLEKMNAIFENFPGDMFPEFPESIPNKFEGDCICVAESGEVSFQRTYPIEPEDYDTAVDYFRTYLQREYDEVEEGQEDEYRIVFSIRLDGVELSIGIEKNDDGWAEVKIELYSLD